MLFRVLTTLVLTLSLATSVFAEGLTGFYGGIKFLDSYQTQWGGGRLTGSGSANTVGFGVSAGFDFYQQSEAPFRAEIEYVIRTAFQGESEMRTFNLDSKVNYNMHTVLANAYYDFYNETIFTPYIGGGIGIAVVDGRFEVNSYDREIDSTVFAWQAGVGVGIALSDNVSADVGYRFLDTSNINTKFYGEDFEMDISAHEFSIGLRFGF